MILFVDRNFPPKYFMIGLFTLFFNPAMWRAPRRLFRRRAAAPRRRCSRSRPTTLLIRQRRRGIALAAAAKILAVLFRVLVFRA